MQDQDEPITPEHAAEVETMGKGDE